MSSSWIYCAATIHNMDTNEVWSCKVCILRVNKILNLIFQHSVPLSPFCAAVYWRLSVWVEKNIRVKKITHKMCDALFNFWSKFLTWQIMKIGYVCGLYCKLQWISYAWHHNPLINFVDRHSIYFECIFSFKFQKFTSYFDVYCCLSWFVWVIAKVIHFFHFIGFASMPTNNKSESRSLK